jgi:O-methyltransferase
MMLKEYLKKIPFLKKIVHSIKYSKDKKKKIESLNLKKDLKIDKTILLFDLINKTSKEGVIVECGVGTGISLSIISKISNKKIYAFDSFEGFPDSLSIHDDKKMSQILRFSKFHYKFMTIDLVKQNLLNNDIKAHDINNKIIFKKGFFPNSFNDFNDEISFLHIDVDLYDSHKHCLDFFFPMLMKGGIVAFDDYYDDLNITSNKGFNKWRGSNIAIDEYVKKNNLELLNHFTGYKYIIKK